MCIFNCSPDPRQEPVRDPGEHPSAPVWKSTDQAIAWRHWTTGTFLEARQRDCPVLLYFAAPGCEGLFSEGLVSVRSLVEERFAAIRVDPFSRPDLARRYAAAGCPALAVMTPDADIFSTAVDIPPRNVELFLLRILEGYEKQRETIERTIEQTREVRLQRDASEISVDEIHEAVVSEYDTLFGGFGRGTKFIEVEVLRFLLEHYIESRNTTSLKMVQNSLDALLNSPMRDTLEGGFFAYSHTPDWKTPAQEKDILDQAGLFQVLLQAAEHDKPEYALAARDLVAHIETQFFDPQQGVFRGRKVGVESGSWWTDPAIYAVRNALLIRAFSAAGRHLQDTRAALMAKSAMKYLLEHCIGPEGEVYYNCTDKRKESGGLLEGQALVSLALLDLYELSGEKKLWDGARQTIGFMEKYLFDSETEAFFDRPASAELEGVANYKLTPYSNHFLPAGNVLAAELYMRLDDLARAGSLLRGNRLGKVSELSASSYARVVLRYGRACRNSL